MTTVTTVTTVTPAADCVFYRSSQTLLDQIQSLWDRDTYSSSLASFTQMQNLWERGSIEPETQPSAPQGFPDPVGPIYKIKKVWSGRIPAMDKNTPKKYWGDQCDSDYESD